MSRNPILERWKFEGRNPKAYTRSRKQERETKDKLIGGRAIPASGAKFRKGDAEVPNLVRIECKATQADSFRVTKEMIGKVTNAALASNQVPFIEIEFINDKGKPIDAYCVMRRGDLTGLLNRLTDAETIVAEAQEASASTGGANVSNAPAKRSLRLPKRGPRLIRPGKPG